MDPGGSGKTRLAVETARPQLLGRLKLMSVLNVWPILCCSKVSSWYAWSCC
jgi:hypothetical protein